MNEHRPKQNDLQPLGAHEVAPAPDLESLAPRLLATVRSVADELRPQARLGASLGLDHSLERDYGLDSLARVELITRIDHNLGVLLGEAALTEAETPRDLLRFITRVGGRGIDLAAPVRQPSLEHGSATDTDKDTASEQYPPDSIQTLVDVFEWHLQRHPQRVLITLYENGDQSVDLRYADLHRDAIAVAAGLRALDLKPGDKVAIMLPTGREFFAAFFGALYAGGVPVPLYPPARPSQLEDPLTRIAGILRNAQACVLVTVERAKPLSHLLRAQVEALRTVTTVADLSIADAPVVRPVLVASDVAFLQYTSGSTGDPKGVILTHANLRAMWRASKVSSADTFVSWLPLYHDMGLIGACLGGLTIGFHVVLMSPLAFLARPARWLETIHRHRGTVSAAPNFAYELCLAKLADADLDGLDLSCWRLAFNGAEAVSPETLERFAARFARCGLKREALTPVYGLAENSVGLAFPPVGRGPLIDRIDRAMLARDGVAKPAQADDPLPLRIVSCGLPLPGHELRVVDTGGRELPEREQGRVQFRGPSSTQGYLNNPAANQGLFDGAWLNTGDLGYMAAGELFLTGREKDIIIRGGLNIHPQELESAVVKLAGIRKGGVAVFAATDPRSGTERLVVLAETKVIEPEQRRQLIQAITVLSATLLGAPADDVVLAPPRRLPRTLRAGPARRDATCAMAAMGRAGSHCRSGAGTPRIALGHPAGLGTVGLERVLHAGFHGVVCGNDVAGRGPAAARGAHADTGSDPPDRLARASGRTGPASNSRAAHRRRQPRQLSRCDRAECGAASRILFRHQARAGRRGADRPDAAQAGRRGCRALRSRARRREHPDAASARACRRIDGVLPRRHVPACQRPAAL